jgi:hypothetical protein
MSKQEFCVNAVVSKLLTDYVIQKDYSELMEDINENHADDFVRLKTPYGPILYKVMFTTSDTIIVQELEMSLDTRFEVLKIHASEWDDRFDSWLTPDDENYEWLGRSSWEDGFRMYGATV